MDEFTFYCTYIYEYVVCILFWGELTRPEIPVAGNILAIYT